MHPRGYDLSLFISHINLWKNCVAFHLVLFQTLKQNLIEITLDRFWTFLRILYSIPLAETLNHPHLTELMAKSLHPSGAPLPAQLNVNFCGLPLYPPSPFKPLKIRFYCLVLKWPWMENVPIWLSTVWPVSVGGKGIYLGQSQQQITFVFCHCIMDVFNVLTVCIV